MSVLPDLVLGGLGQVECVRVPGWAALGVAALLTAPRMLREYLSGGEQG